MKIIFKVESSKNIWHPKFNVNNKIVQNKIYTASLHRQSNSKNQILLRAYLSLRFSKTVIYALNSTV